MIEMNKYKCEKINSFFSFITIEPISPFAFLSAGNLFLPTRSYQARPPPSASKDFECVLLFMMTSSHT